MLNSMKWLLGAALLVVAACSQDAGQSSSGTTKSTDTKYNQAAYMESAGGQTYTSNYFDMSLELPQGWVYASEQVASSVLNLGTDVAAGDDEMMRRQLDATMRKSLPIFVLSKYEIGTPRPDNSSLMGIAENVNYAPGVKNGEDYFDNVKILSAQTGMGIEYSDTYGSRTIGGKRFAQMDAVVPAPGLTIEQSYYAYREGDFVIVIIGTYSSSGEQTKLESVLDTISFK